MPDQRAGIVYGGEVYPLHTGDRIELADTPVKKTLCSKFVPASSPIPYAAGKPKQNRGRDKTPAVDRWYVESNRFGHYLVFDATATTAKQVVTLMEKAGLGVRRWDESARESDNGELYDWFIRLEFDGSRDDCLQRVTTALKSGASTSVPASKASAVAAAAAAAELRQLRAEVQQLRADNLTQRADAVLQKVQADQHIKRLTAELDVAMRTNAKTQQQLTKMRQKHRAERDGLRRQLSDFERQLAAARTGPTADRAADHRLQEVLNAKAETEHHYFEAQAAAEAASQLALQLENELVALRTRLSGAEAEAQTLRGHVERTEAELAETRNEARERRTATRTLGGPPQGSIEAFLARLLPRTDLDPDSLETLLTWPDPGDAVDYLRQVNTRRAEPRGKKALVNKSGWWEIPKVNIGRTGKETSGRIYYAVTNNQRVVAVLHEKKDDKEQKRFIAQLPDKP